jgi:hypothetical protein
VERRITFADEARAFSWSEDAQIRKFFRQPEGSLPVEQPAELSGGKMLKKGSLARDTKRSHNQSEAARIIDVLGKKLGLQDAPDALILL